MSFDLSTLRPFLLVAAFWLIAVPLLTQKKERDRAIIAGFTAFIGLRYLVWRLFQTVVPFSGSTGENTWVVVVYLTELLAFLEICIFLLIMSRTNSRSAEADEYRKKLTRLPSVDVFIPTYNEGLDVLERTILGAKHLDYPDFKVWVLDDGQRGWLREFCEKHEVGYLARTEHSHAKAGNINNGLQHTQGELFAVFDADFVPLRNFLQRTVGFFVFNDDIGLVQTPQHYFNRDPIQSNLYLEKNLPDEQRLFFDSMAPCRDRWNAAFCCGSCSIIRRQAVEAIGGIPTSSITEDLLTTLSLLTVHYRTVYLNEKLSQGMSAESLKGYFIQRGRWCRGGIQCFFVPEGPLHAKGLTFLQRVLFAPYSWISQPITRFMMLVVPLVYLWFGLTPLYLASSPELIAYQFPMLLAFVLAVRWLTAKKYTPILSTAVNIFGMFRILPVVISSLVKPFGTPFRVTPKGTGSSTGIDWYILIASGSVILLTFSGLCMNFSPEHQIIPNIEFFPYVLFWSCFNIVILFLCMLMCFDTPRKRREERFLIGEATSVDGRPAVIADLSLNGCKLTHGENHRIAEQGQTVSFTIPGVREPVAGVVRNANDSALMLEFSGQTDAQREDLIVKLFTGDYDNEIHETGGIFRLLRPLFRRAFGKEMK